MVDWYKCSSAHSQPLNANLKAYAAWWLWARLVGWIRVDAKQHYTEDVWVGAAIGIVNNLIFTKKYQDKKVVINLAPIEKGAAVTISLLW